MSLDLGYFLDQGFKIKYQSYPLPYLLLRIWKDMSKSNHHLSPIHAELTYSHIIIKILHISFSLHRSCSCNHSIQPGDPWSQNSLPQIHPHSHHEILELWVICGGSWRKKTLSGWWLNQPIGKICSSKWVHLPQIGMNIKKNETTTQLCTSSYPDTSGVSNECANSISWSCNSFFSSWIHESRCFLVGHNTHVVEPQKNSKISPARTSPVKMSMIFPRTTLSL